MLDKCNNRNIFLEVKEEKWTWQIKKVIKDKISFEGEKVRWIDKEVLL